MTSKILAFLFILLGESPVFVPVSEQHVTTIHFEKGDFKISNVNKDKLDEIVKKSVPDSITYLKIFGYSDTAGSAKYNEDLSRKRAYEVYHYLARRIKIDSSKIYITWLGEKAEGYDLHFPDAHIQQRCVDVIASFGKRVKN